MSHPAKAIGGPILTPSTRWLLLLALLAGVIILYRFFTGLGPVTALNDGYPWGLWIAFDVVTGTALACGGYAVAILAYVFNQGRYHPLVRPALLTSLLGYGLAAVAIVVDVGRYWLLYKVVISPGDWNLSSVLLEVALCVMAYLVVLAIELSPAVLETLQEGRGGLGRLARRVLPLLDRVLLLFIALGILLPTMHQSSLGGVLMVATSKLHPLWHTPWLPLLFLLSCIAMGYGAVIFEATASSRALGRPQETGILATLAVPISAILGAYLLLRFGDLAWRGRLGLTVTSGWLSLLFWAEVLLFLTPVLLLGRRKTRADPGALFGVGMMVMAAGVLYRFDGYIVAFNPGHGWHYFPAVPEILATLGLVAAEILLYIAIIKRFPILAAVEQTAAPRQQGRVPAPRVSTTLPSEAAQPQR